jgi:hypothetical protein
MRGCLEGRLRCTVLDWAAHFAFSMLVGALPCNRSVPASIDDVIG